MCASSGVPAGNSPGTYLVPRADWRGRGRCGDLGLGLGSLLRPGKPEAGPPTSAPRAGLGKLGGTHGTEESRHPPLAEGEFLGSSRRHSGRPAARLLRRLGEANDGGGGGLLPAL